MAVMMIAAHHDVVEVVEEGAEVEADEEEDVAVAVAEATTVEENVGQKNTLDQMGTTMNYLKKPDRTIPNLTNDPSTPC